MSFEALLVILNTTNTNSKNKKKNQKEPKQQPRKEQLIYKLYERYNVVIEKNEENLYALEKYEVKCISKKKNKITRKYSYM